MWLLYLLINCGEQNRNCGDSGFACFFSAPHVGRSLAEFFHSWGLELLTVAVSGDSRLFRVARSMTLLPERLDTPLLSLPNLYKKCSWRETALLPVWLMIYDQSYGDSSCPQTVWIISFHSDCADHICWYWEDYFRAIRLRTDGCRETETGVTMLRHIVDLP